MLVGVKIVVFIDVFGKVDQSWSVNVTPSARDVIDPGSIFMPRRPQNRLKFGPLCLLLALLAVEC